MTSGLSQRMLKIVFKYYSHSVPRWQFCKYHFLAAVLLVSDLRGQWRIVDRVCHAYSCLQSDCFLTVVSVKMIGGTAAHCQMKGWDLNGTICFRIQSCPIADPK